MSFSTYPSPGDIPTRIAQRYRLRPRLTRALAMIDDGDTETLLRSHLIVAIRPWEIRERDNLDELLAGLGVMHIAGVDHPKALLEAGLDPSDVMRLLHQPHVRDYYEAIYPFALPILLRECLDGNGRYRSAFCAERRTEEWSRNMARFLVLDAAFNAEGPMRDFLALLDDYRVRGLWLEDLEEALGDAREMRKWLGSYKRFRILEGLQDFLSFSEQLDELLAAMRSTPIARGQVWLNFGYWYGGGGPRMRRVAGWLMRTLDHVATTIELPLLEDAGQQQPTAHIDKVGTVLRHLTSMEHYPASLIEELSAELTIWKYHTNGQDQRPGRRGPARDVRRPT